MAGAMIKAHQYSQPVWELPSVQATVEEVMKFIQIKLAAKNFFAWKEFVEDLKVDIQMEIYKYEDLYLQGKYKKTGIGGYCNMAMQGAKNYVGHYNAIKRKVNHETASLDSMLETEKGSMPFQVSDGSCFADLSTLMIDFESVCGNKTIAIETIEKGEKKVEYATPLQIAQRILDGESFNDSTMKQLRSPKLRRLLKEENPT